jgi:hypothetical protein
MATKTQYDFFKAVYDEETERYNALEGRAKLYLTIITFYLGAIAFKIDDVMKFVSQFRMPIWLYMLLTTVLLIALLLTVLATRIRVYESVCDLKRIIGSFGESPPNDEDFLDDHLVELAVATDRNRKENDRVAAVLQWASYSLWV